VPISTPGWDNAPFLASAHYISADPDTGIQNVGNYRGQIKAPRRLGMNPSVEIRPGIYVHLGEDEGARREAPVRGRARLPARNLLRGGQQAAGNLDELVVAGGLAGFPIMWCGRARSIYWCRRKPSESSVIRKAAMEPLFLSYLKKNLSVRGMKRVAMHEPLTSLYAVIAIQFERGTPETEVWRALQGASVLHRFAGKWMTASTRTSIQKMPMRCFGPCLTAANRNMICTCSPTRTGAMARAARATTERPRLS
jgi:hypothetical protein